MLGNQHRLVLSCVLSTGVSPYRLLGGFGKYFKLLSGIIEKNFPNGGETNEKVTHLRN